MLSPSATIDGVIVAGSNETAACAGFAAGEALSPEETSPPPQAVTTATMARVERKRFSMTGSVQG
jgi:hypothetical protein